MVKRRGGVVMGRRGREEYDGKDVFGSHTS